MFSKPIFKKITYFTRKVDRGQNGDFENDFRDMISARRFEVNHHIRAFNTVLQNYHRILGGILLDRRQETINFAGCS